MMSINAKATPINDTDSLFAILSKYAYRVIIAFLNDS